MDANQKIRLLIVDDIAETRENIRRLLQFESDVTVVGAASTGKQAIQLAQELVPDVVLMDINMPDIDGITATEFIRKKKPQIQVVMLSVQGDIKYMRMAMRAGACDFLTKPPMEDELISSIRRAEELSHLEQKKILDDLNNATIKDSKPIELFSQMEAKQLDLSRFDCSTRIELYQITPRMGKLVDKFESLLTGIAHDLKSPLSIAISILEILATGDKQRIKLLKTIWRKLVYSKWVADNFLGICLSERPSNGSVTLLNIVTNTVSLISDQIPKEVKVNVQIPPNLKIETDENALRLVLLNLITNSIESIGNQIGEIKISTTRREKQTSIIVSDTGASISKDIKTNLFKLGFTTKSNHLGNGLFVSKRLLNQINADLLFKSGFVQHKAFEIVIKNTGLRLIGNSKQLDEIKNNLQSLNLRLFNLRNQAMSKKDQEFVEKEFDRQTSIFTNRLTKELTIIESMILDSISKLDNNDFEISDALKKVAKNCTYCRLLARNILEIGEGDSLKLTTVSLIEVVEEVLSLVDRKMPRDLYSIEFEVDPSVDDIEADALQLMQVFMNLIRNALDAMPNGGQLGIHIGQLQNKVFVRIHDTGTGVSPEIFSKLFKMGFSTKPSGYGIGLYSGKNIVEKHHGTIEVVSKNGKGTTFTVFLPRYQASRG